MIITFCGHADFQKTSEQETQLLSFFEKTIGDHKAKFYLGGYGLFDEFAYECCKKYKKTHLNVDLVLVIPYLHFEKSKVNDYFEKYDETIYPPIEDKPLKFAIVYRNQYMIDAADLVVAHVTRSWGGAYRTLQYAKRKGKKIVNFIK